jgi:type IV pilus assembly protein PilN
MIRINLLPFRAARKKENIRRQVSIFLLSFVLVAVLLCFYQLNLSHKAGKLSAKISETKAQLDKYNKINKEIAEIKTKLANLQKKLAIMAELEAGRFEPVQLLDTMTEMVVAKRMWFTRLESNEKDIEINGIALDNKTVADFMVRLENCGLFSNVVLNTLKYVSIRKTDLKSFQITCRKKPMTQNLQAEAKK